jgi:predicted metal-dependent enzyme (double-stranded beta helix superfamily)
MAASDDFEAWVIAWPPGGAIELHDHGGSAGAVVGVAGRLRETSIVSKPSGGIVLRSSTMELGRPITFGGQHVHDIVNVGETAAISVHVYAPRLSSMTYYRMSEDVLEAGATVRYQFGEAVA